MVKGRVWGPPTPSPPKGLVTGRPSSQLKIKVPGADRKAWGAKGGGTKCPGPNPSTHSIMEASMPGWETGGDGHHRCSKVK